MNSQVQNQSSVDVIRHYGSNVTYLREQIGTLQNTVEGLSHERDRERAALHQKQAAEQGEQRRRRRARSSESPAASDFRINCDASVPAIK